MTETLKGDFEEYKANLEYYGASALNRKFTEAGEKLFKTYPRCLNSLAWADDWKGKCANLSPELKRLTAVHFEIQHLQYEKIRHYVIALGLFVIGALGLTFNILGLTGGLALAGLAILYAFVNWRHDDTPRIRALWLEIMGDENHNGLINLIRSGFMLQYDDKLKLPPDDRTMPQLRDGYEPLVVHGYSGPYDPNKTVMPPATK